MRASAKEWFLCVTLPTTITISDEKCYCLTGRKKHKKYSLGDHVRIKVAKANLEKKQLDYTLVEDIPEKKSK